MTAEHAKHGQAAAPESPPHERESRTALVERLFREHNEALIRFLRARLRSYQEAREVAQEAYVRLLSLDEPGAVSYLRAFLFRTAANIAIDRRRRDEVHARATDLPLFQVFADDRTPERVAVADETIERLQALIAALPPKCQKAFLLNYVYGMDFASIALEMQLSQRMVRKYVARALVQCQEGLDLGGRE